MDIMFISRPITNEIKYVNTGENMKRETKYVEELGTRGKKEKLGGERNWEVKRRRRN